MCTTRGMEIISDKAGMVDSSYISPRGYSQQLLITGSAEQIKVLPASKPCVCLRKGSIAQRTTPEIVL